MQKENIVTKESEKIKPITGSITHILAYIIIQTMYLFRHYGTAYYAVLYRDDTANIL